MSGTADRPVPDKKPQAAGPGLRYSAASAPSKRIST